MSRRDLAFAFIVGTLAGVLFAAWAVVGYLEEHGLIHRRDSHARRRGKK